MAGVEVNTQERNNTYSNITKQSDSHLNARWCCNVADVIPELTIKIVGHEGDHTEGVANPYPAMQCREKGRLGKNRHY